MKFETRAGAFVLLCWFATPASAFDCTKAASTVEKAICADPELRILDDDMAAAYAEVRKLSTSDERAMLAVSQRNWIASRESCPASESGIVACIKTATGERLQLLEGKPDSGPGAGGRIIPTFIVQEGTEKAYDLDITMLRFADPETAGQKRFNAISENMVKRVRQGPHGEETDGRIWAMEETLRLTYASPRLFSLMFVYWYDMGGAHGNGATENFNFDMETGKDYGIEDFFSEDAAAELMAKCKAQIIAEKQQRLKGETYDAATDEFLKDDVIAEHISTLGSWNFQEREASVSFDPYVIGSYAEGGYECRFPMPDLKAIALDGAPLP
jgi:uncharacterized protein